VSDPATSTPRHPLPANEALGLLRRRLHGSRTSARSGASAGSNASAGSSASASPASRPSWPQWTRLAGFLVVSGLAPMVVHGAYRLGIATLVLTYVVVSLGFYLIFCLTGQFAFSQAAIFGLGAYTAAWADRFTGFWFSLVIELAIVAAIAAAFLLLVRRASELYFAIATLGLAEVALLVFQNWTSFTASGGEVRVLGTPVIFGTVIDTPAGYFWLALGFAGGALILVKLIELSPLRREAIAVRDHEQVALAMGVNTLRVRVVMFTLGCVLAAAGGSLFAHTQGYIDPDSFSVNLGIDIFLIVILGGVASMWGCVIGSTFVVVLPELFRSAATYSELIFALCLLAVIFLLPDGFVGLGAQARSVTDRRRRRSVATPPPVTTAPEADRAPGAATDGVREPVSRVVE
jgi:branched-chain amino acid transport system permease protein